MICMLTRVGRWAGGVYICKCFRTAIHMCPHEYIYRFSFNGDGIGGQLDGQALVPLANHQHNIQFNPCIWLNYFFVVVLVLFFICLLCWK